MNKVLVGIVLVLAILILWTPACETASSGAMACATQTAVSAYLTATPKPTVNPMSAILGGTEAAFLARYGKPIQTAWHGGDWRLPSTPYGALTVGIGYQDLGYPDNECSGGHTPEIARINYLEIDPDVPGAPLWDAHTAQAAVTSFFPPDAEYIEDTSSTTLDERAPYTRLELFRSQLLANTFSPGLFRDQRFVDNTGYATPGTFAFVCWGDDSTHISRCRVWLGLP